MNEPGIYVPIHDAALEAKALGILIKDNEQAKERLTQLNVGLFYDERNRAAYKAIATLVSEFTLPTILAVEAKLLDQEEAFTIETARPLLVGMENSAPMPFELPEIVAKLKDLARRRLLERECATRWLTLIRDRETTISGLAGDIADSCRTLGASEYKLLAKPLIHFKPLPDDDPSVLIGPRRWCTRGSGNFLVAYTGIGKSTLTITQSMAFALGKPCLGFAPNGPLKSVIIQSEDDPGDIASMMQGFYDVLQPSPEEIELLEKNILVITENSCTGIRFLNNVVRPALQQYRPDLLWVNPISAYFGGDLKDPALTAEFFRNTLNPMLTEFGAAFWGIHHATKPNKDRAEWQGADLAYLGAGNADLANWSRETVVLREVGDGVFEMVCTKRWRKLGWTDADGNPARSKQIAYGLGGKQYWRLADDADLARVGAQHYTEDRLVALVPDGGIDKADLVKLAANQFKQTDRSVRSHVDDLAASKWRTVDGLRIKGARLKERERSRREVYPDTKGGRAVVWITRVGDVQTEMVAV